jgi:hypothetical protein
MTMLRKILKYLIRSARDVLVPWLLLLVFEHRFVNVAQISDTYIISATAVWVLFVCAWYKAYWSLCDLITDLLSRTRRR